MRTARRTTGPSGPTSAVRPADKNAVRQRAVIARRLPDESVSLPAGRCSVSNHPSGRCCFTRYASARSTANTIAQALQSNTVVELDVAVDLVTPLPAGAPAQANHFISIMCTAVHDILDNCIEAGNIASTRQNPNFLARHFVVIAF